MTFVLVPNKTRGVRLLVDKKHVKTIPKHLSKTINNHTVKLLVYDNKRLNQEERLFLKNYGAYENWKEKLAIREKHLYELIKNATPVQKNHVFIFTGGERLEFVLDNKIKITVPEKVYRSLLIKESTTHSNF